MTTSPWPAYFRRLKHHEDAIYRAILTTGRSWREARQMAHYYAYHPITPRGAADALVRALALHRSAK